MGKLEMDTNKEEGENSHPLPNFPLKWSPFHICNSSYAAAGLPLQNSSISSKFEDSLFNISSSKSLAAVDTVSTSPPNTLLGKSDRKIKLTVRKSTRTVSTDSGKKPTITKEQKESEIRVNSKMRDQEEKRSDPMAMSLRPPKLTTTTKRKTVEERGKEKAPKQSKKNNNKPICPDLKISLSPNEIADDLFALTEERRLSRIFRKRPKNVQKTLDTLYPGILLHTITPEKYNVPRDAQRSHKL